MKKGILFAILTGFGLLFSTNVYAASAPDCSDPDYFYANGTPIVISARNDGNAGATITWDGDSCDVAASIKIFGGGVAGTSFDSSSITMNGGTVTVINGGGQGTKTESADVTTTNVIINDGTVRSVFGGGVLTSNVTTANVTVNGGKFREITGGGTASLNKTTSVGTATSKENSPCKVLNAKVIVNGGSTESYSYGIIYGGGQGYNYVANAELTITNGNFGNVYVTPGGSNGYTKSATLNISGGNIDLVQSVNNGITDSATTTVTGGTINKLYVGSEDDTNLNGTINGASLVVNGGTVASLQNGRSANAPLTNINGENSTIKTAYVASSVTNDATGAKHYSVSVADNLVNGSLKASVSIVNGQPTALITVTPDSGYMLDTLYVDDVATTSTSVLLTEEDTLIRATFKVDTTGDDSNTSNPNTFVNTNLSIVGILVLMIGALSITFLVNKKESNY